MTLRVSLRGRTKWLVATVCVLAIVMTSTYAYVRMVTPKRVGTQVAIPVSGYATGTVKFDHGLWVARQSNADFYVFLNRDPHRGEPLNWVEGKGLFMQAASYGIDGSCLEGPCNPGPSQGLYRVDTRLDGENLIVYPQVIISGGLNPESTWVTDLKHFFAKMTGNAPSSPTQKP